MEQGVFSTKTNANPNPGEILAPIKIRAIDKLCNKLVNRFFYPFAAK